VKKLVLAVVAVAAIYGAYSLASKRQQAGPAASGPEATEGIMIAPPAAFARTTLQARLEGKLGAGGDPGVCRWFVNDTEVADVTTANLEPGHFRKGDSVRVEVDVVGVSKLVSETIVIANTPPRISNASADLKQEPTAQIYLRIASADADNDPVTYTYEWFKNGERVEGQTGSSIDVSHFRKGDEVHANVTASDGQDLSSPRESDPIKLGSNAPKITSTPPQALEDGRNFVYQVKVSSSSSSLKYELVDAPEGMTIDSRGKIEWAVPLQETADAKSEHKAVVRVTDSMGGHTTQAFSITTSIQASSTANE
jgi:hypothetical protein